jgi:hypothetical protein
MYGGERKQSYFYFVLSPYTYGRRGVLLEWGVGVKDMRRHVGIYQNYLK